VEVPLFQRQYVWSKEIQWAPLWEDFARKFTENPRRTSDAPVHFLGAMVLDQKEHTDRMWSVDRSSTANSGSRPSNSFLRHFVTSVARKRARTSPKNARMFILNSGMMANPAWTSLRSGRPKRIVNSSLPFLQRDHARRWKPTYPLCRAQVCA